uniref:Uncharacterized protein n=1 Tax=Anguilla anguilla TaxID=7936 RepID=A0A0E9VP61_ANGAN
MVSLEHSNHICVILHLKPRVKQNIYGM